MSTKALWTTGLQRAVSRGRSRGCGCCRMETGIRLHSVRDPRLAEYGSCSPGEWGDTTRVGAVTPTSDSHARRAATLRGRAPYDDERNEGPGICLRDACAARRRRAGPPRRLSVRGVTQCVFVAERPYPRPSHPPAQHARNADPRETGYRLVVVVGGDGPGPGQEARAPPAYPRSEPSKPPGPNSGARSRSTPQALEASSPCLPFTSLPSRGRR